MSLSSSLFRGSAPPAGGGSAVTFIVKLIMYVVYAIYNKKHDKIYIGQCENLSLRLRLHNNKTFKNSYTARFDDVWSLIYKEETANRQEALKREKQLKSFRGREFIKKHIPA